MYVSKPCVLSWKWNLNTQTYTLLFTQKSYLWSLLRVYVCLKSLCLSWFLNHTYTLSTSHLWIMMRVERVKLCMYVSKPWACEGFWRLRRNARHPNAWPLGDPQKVIHIDTILILVYIHFKHTYMLSHCIHADETYIHVCTLVRLPEVPPLTIQKKIN